MKMKKLAVLLIMVILVLVNVHVVVGVHPASVAARLSEAQVRDLPTGTTYYDPQAGTTYTRNTGGKWVSSSGIASVTPQSDRFISQSIHYRHGGVVAPIPFYHAKDITPTNSPGGTTFTDNSDTSWTKVSTNNWRTPNMEPEDKGATDYFVERGLGIEQSSPVSGVDVPSIGMDIPPIHVIDVVSNLDTYTSSAGAEITRDATGNWENGLSDAQMILQMGVNGGTMGVSQERAKESVYNFAEEQGRPPGKAPDDFKDKPTFTAPGYDGDGAFPPDDDQAPPDADEVPPDDDEEEEDDEEGDWDDDADAPVAVPSAFDNRVSVISTALDDAETAEDAAKTARDLSNRNPGNAALRTAANEAEENLEAKRRAVIIAARDDPVAAMIAIEADDTLTPEQKEELIDKAAKGLPGHAGQRAVTAEQGATDARTRANSLREDADSRRAVRQGIVDRSRARADGLEERAVDLEKEAREKPSDKALQERAEKARADADQADEDADTVAARADDQADIEDAEAKAAEEEADAAQKLAEAAEVPLGYKIFFGTEWLETFKNFWVNNPYAGFSGYSSLFFDEEFLEDWKEQVGEIFCNEYFPVGGIDCWTDIICKMTNDKLVGSSTIIAQMPDGSLRPVAHVEAERGLPIEFVNASGKQTLYFYIVTYTVTNPSEDEMMFHNIVFTRADGVEYRWYDTNDNQSQILGGGSVVAAGMGALGAYSPRNYTSVCITLHPGIENVMGDKQDKICNRIVHIDTVTPTVGYGPPPLPPNETSSVTDPDAGIGPGGIRIAGHGF